MPDTICDLFDAAVERRPDKVWLVFEDREWTYAQARDAALRAAAGLADLGARPGEIVFSAMPNSPEHLFLWLGSAYAGTVLLTANPRSTPSELEGLARQADAAVTIGEGPGQTPAAALQGHDPAEPARRPGPDDACVLIPTSGTTGRSKLVTQTQRAYAWAGEGFPHWMELGAEDRMMTSLPLFHINATAYSTMGSVAAGATLVLLERFSASGFLDSARRHGATEFNAIGAMLEILMRQPERPDDADNPLRLAYAGPAPAEARHLEIERRFGIRIVCGYGLSESPYGTIWAHGTRPYGTLGSIRQHPRLGVINEGRIVDGELELRNPVVMKGYWGMPDETAEVLRPDGWLRTGDLVEEVGGGNYLFLGRRKEVLRRRGENVSPTEIEQALEAHPLVLEAAVVGVPSDLGEEDIKGFVLVADPSAVDLADVRASAAGLLTPFKVPRYLEAVTELPRTPTGRIAKPKLPRERNDQEVDFE